LRLFHEMLYATRNHPLQSSPMNAPAPKNLRGIVAMCAAMAVYIANDSLVKLATAQGLPAAEIMALRGLIATVIFTSGILLAGEGRSVTRLGHPLVMGRGALDALIALTYIPALALMPIGDLTAVALLSPMIITLLSAIVLKEEVGWRRWSAVVVGFAGMLIVVGPSASSFSLPAALGLLTAIGVAVRDLMTRMVPSHVPSATVGLSTTLATTLLGFLLWPFSPPWPMPGLPALGLLAGSALMLAIGNIMAAIAFRDVDVSVVSPFRFTNVIWAILSGWVLFGDTPTPIVLAGATLIVGSGIYTLHRERVRGRSRD